ncbi:hypothetical protein [Actinophytocola gossypii]|uniref:HEAT repeat domain-containing protein n=1 Tax=Actinophytocola gossypii TaxID=2812003 RepID=A0ABT2J6J6_9PSEU|nr:hypothetical protein [Actinophytocola gossypii]MCT2583475.1 hypothetical protein [Actinophytocola gossypii]
MARDLATKAELMKLARALHTTPEGVRFAASLEYEEIRRLRERVTAALYDEHRTAFQRVAAITRLLPTAVNVRITLRAFTPFLAARVAGEMAPERAAELANRMPVEYLAEGSIHLDPRRAAPLIQRMDPDRVLAVIRELVDRTEYVTLGRLLDAATSWIIRGVAATVSDEALLRIGFYAECDAQLTTAVSMLPAPRLREVVHTALTGPLDLRSAGLSLIGRLTDDRLRGRIAEYAAEADDDTLTLLLRTALDEDAADDLLTALTAMGERARHRVLALPALADHDTLARLLRTPH